MTTEKCSSYPINSSQAFPYVGDMSKPPNIPGDYSAKDSGIT
jgi:hypothetical protein